jgi:hypothetical protein
MSTVENTPRPGVEGWVERTSMVGRLETRWLERTLDVRTGRVESYYGDYLHDVTATRTARTSPRTTPSPLVHTAPAPTVERPRPTVTLQQSATRLLVRLNPRAVRTIQDEIRAQRHAIETRQLETGGGLFGPPIRGWHQQAHVAVANVAVASRGQNKVEIAYGQIEAKEADLIRFQDSPLRRAGCWHCHPTCPAGRVGEPSQTDMQTWLSELDRINQSRRATRYLGIIATAGKRGWTSPQFYGWIVRQDKRNRPICEPATVAVGR